MRTLSRTRLVFGQMLPWLGVLVLALAWTSPGLAQVGPVGSGDGTAAWRFQTKEARRHGCGKAT